MIHGCRDNGCSPIMKLPTATARLTTWNSFANTLTRMLPWREIRLWQPPKEIRGCGPCFICCKHPCAAASACGAWCGWGLRRFVGAVVSGCSWTGVESSRGLCPLRTLNDPNIRSVEADIDAMPLARGQRPFDHVLAKPAYFDRTLHCCGPNLGS